MPDMPPARGQFTIGRVIGRTFRVIGRHWGAIGLVCILADLVGVAIAFGVDWAEAQFFQAPENPYWRVLSEGLTTAVVQLVPGALLLGGLSHLAFTDPEDRRAILGPSLQNAFQRVVPLVALGALTLVAIFGATLLLIVPGIILSLMWFVAAPVCAVEKTGVLQALSRSMALTKGRRWELFALGAVYFAAVFLLSLVINGAAMLWPDPIVAASGVGSSINNLYIAIVSTVGAIGAAVTYTELRRTKEGVLPNQVAAVFE